MIEITVKHMSESGMLNDQNKTEDEQANLCMFFNLKRWKRMVVV